MSTRERLLLSSSIRTNRNPDWPTLRLTGLTVAVGGSSRSRLHEAGAVASARSMKPRSLETSVR